MAQINVMFWNIQDFGWKANYRGPGSIEFCNFTAEMVFRAQIDILFIQEVHPQATPPPLGNDDLGNLLTALNQLPEPMNNWSYEWIRGAVKNPLVGPTVPPYATANDLQFDGAHYEGYAMFFNFNISKFTLETAAPLINPAGGIPIPNQQSSGIITQHGPLPGNLLCTGNFNGTTVAAIGAPPVVIPAGTTFLPAGTIIGPGGVDITGLPGAVPNFKIIPGNYTLTERWDVPPAGTVLLPLHSLGLVIYGRNYNPAIGQYDPYIQNPPPPNNWQILTFGDNGVQTVFKMRRPAFATIKLNSRNTAGGIRPNTERLIPIHVYHAPSAAMHAWRNLVDASASHSLYQVFDHTTNNWIEPERVIFAGDLNYPLNPNNTPYTNFTNPYPAPGYGAFCQILNAAGNAIADGIRINSPVPPPPAVPPILPADLPQNKTTVNLKRPPYTPADNILSTDLNSYRRMAIDNAFFAGFTNAEAPIHPFGVFYDILSNVQGLGGASQFNLNTIQALLEKYCLAMEGYDFNHIINNYAGPPPSIMRDVYDFDDFFDPLITNNFYQNTVAGGGVVVAPAPCPQRAPAEFVNLLISDHMPVLFRINL